MLVEGHLPITAARLSVGGRVGASGRRGADPASSGQVQRIRLNPGGNRQLNRAFYIIALAQSRFHAPAKAYVARRMGTDGKSWREAIRALKRQLVRTVFRLLLEGASVELHVA